MKTILGTRNMPNGGRHICRSTTGADKSLSILLLFLTLSLVAQNGAPIFNHLGLKEGLSGETITALCQDRRGFLWIGTNGQGINCFDGHEVRVWRHNKRDASSLCNDLVWSIVEDAEGSIWVGTQRGVSRLNPFNGRCENYLDDGAPIVESYLFQDSMNFLWSASNYGLSRFNPAANRFERFLAFESPTRLIKTDTGAVERIWVGGRGLSAFNPRTGSIRTFYPFPGEPDAERNKTRLKIDPYGNIWVFCWGGGLQRFRPETGRFERFIWHLNPKFPGMANIPFDVAESFDGAGKRIFWICTEQGVFRFPLESTAFPALDQPHRLLQPDNSNAHPDREVHRLLTDHQGNLWFGAMHGLYHYRKEQEYIHRIRLPAESNINRVVFTEADEVLVSSRANSPLMILDVRQHLKKVFQNLPAGSINSAGKRCWSVAKDEAEDLIYAATFQGLVVYDQKNGKTRWHRWNPKEGNGLIGPKITHVLPLGEGRVLLGFWQQGLQVFDTRQGKGIWTSQNSGAYLWCLKRCDGMIWAAEWGLYTFDPKTNSMTEMTPPGERGVKYYDVLKDRGNRIWVATDYGFCRLDVGNHRILEKYTAEDGLAATEVSSMAEDSLGRLWLATPEGLRVFNPETGKFFILDKEILHPGEIQRAADGKFWVSAGNTIQVFNPGLFDVLPPSQVYITGLRINEKDTFADIPFERIRQIRLQPGQDALTFSFTAVDLDNFGKTRFNYILEGLQTEWVHAGTNRLAAFVNLRPGAYTFRVRPEDAGDDAFYDATLQVIVTDYFWERLWFKVAAIILLTGLLFSLVFLEYTRRLRARNLHLQARLAIQEERNRISRDLHDDIGSGLSTIRLLSDFALSKAGNGDMRTEVRKIAESAGDLSEKIHEIIWATNPKNDTLEHLISFLHQYAVSLMGDSRFDLHARIPEAIPPATISGEHRRALFLVCKEALANVARHARATRVDIEFACSRSRLDIRIRDNGCGFDPATAGTTGNGLVNMPKRMEDIGGRFRIESDESGTTVVFGVGS